MGLEHGKGMWEWGCDLGYPGDSRAPLLIPRYKFLISSGFDSLSPSKSQLLAPELPDFGSFWIQAAPMDQLLSDPGSSFPVLPLQAHPSCFSSGIFPHFHPTSTGIPGWTQKSMPLTDSRSSRDPIKGRNINHVN